jgi:hypothetical protein
MTSGQLYMKLCAVILLTAGYFTIPGCRGEPEFSAGILDSLTFYASFDNGFGADLASGDPCFYTAPSWTDRSRPRVVDSGNEHFTIHENRGRHANALWIDNSWTPVYFFKAAGNIAYREEDWSGTVSFWLKLSPKDDLPEGFSDPIQLTDKSWNDGALFVDFTDDDDRIFRFAFFPDREVWDPEKRNWEDVPREERPMIEVTEPVFHHDEWTHLAFTFQNFNSGKPDAVINTYINGSNYAGLTGMEQTVTWNPEQAAIWLGYNYRGYFDELAIFDRALTEAEVQELFSLPAPVREFLNQPE